MTDSTNITWATDDVGGIHYPRLKLEFGADGTATDISYSKPVPINIAVRGDSLAIASTSCAPIRVILSASSSSTATIVAAQTSARIRVLDYALICRATTSVYFGASTTAVTGTMVLNSKSGISPGFNPFGHFQTSPNQPLTVITGEGAVAGHLTYVNVNYVYEVNISNNSSTHSVSTPSTATAGYRLQNDGNARRAVAGSYALISNEWMVSGSASDYEARATLVSGDTPTGTLGSWLALSTTRTWELTTTSGSLTATITIEIRKASTGEVLDSASIVLTAEST